MSVSCSVETAWTKQQNEKQQQQEEEEGRAQAWPHKVSLLQRLVCAWLGLGSSDNDDDDDDANSSSNSNSLRAQVAVWQLQRKYHSRTIPLGGLRCVVT